MSSNSDSPEYEFATTKHPNLHFEPFTLGGGVTIDTSTNDDGFLVCARTGWPNPPGDSSYAQAAANLLRYGFADRNVSQLVLVGHGNSGIISTGDGMLPSTATGYISAGTYANWAPSFAQLKNHGTFLTLCGCDCAVGSAGSSFLSQLANLLDRPVRGRTGLVYLTCPGAYLSYENGSVWQVAQPGRVPPAILEPQYPYDDSCRTFHLMGLHQLPLEAIISAEVSFHKKNVKHLNKQEATQLLRAANTNKKIHIRGSLGAILTAEVTVELDSHEGAQKVTLKIYNDRIAQLAEEPGSYYFCSPPFREQLKEIRSENFSD
jgi:uncharacterized protein DUF4347